MARIRGDNHAFGWPGLEPRWTHGDKDGIGTAYSAASRIWFTVWNGIVTEVYYPTVDMPQMRDVQLLFTDGQSFFHQETQYLESRIQRMPSCLGYRVEGTDPEGRYAYVKEIIADPHLPCLPPARDGPGESGVAFAFENLRFVCPPPRCRRFGKQCVLSFNPVDVNCSWLRRTAHG
jgi:glucoamylase